MGLNYGFNIYCHRSRLWGFIDSVMELAKPSERNTTTIIFGDQQKVVPQWLSYTSNTLSLNDPECDDSFCLSIPFVIDAALKEYIAEKKLRDDQGRVYIGCIYFSIVTNLEAIGITGFDADLVWFQFIAATSDMSRMFRKSQSVQQTFLELAKKQEAVYCLFATGGQGDPTVLWLDGNEYSVDIPDDFLPISEVRQIVKSTSL